MNHLLPLTSVYFPKQIRLIRENLGMRYTEFGRLCDLSNTSIIRMEKENSGTFITKRSWNKINMALAKMNYFDRDGIPKIEIKNHITYARDEKPIHVTPYTEKPKRKMIEPDYHPTIRTFWQPIKQQSFSI